MDVPHSMFFNQVLILRNVYIPIIYFLLLRREHMEGKDVHRIKGEMLQFSDKFVLNLSKIFFEE